MDTRKRDSSSEMQVTSIRLEFELKERLREISGEQGYQALIRDVLWQFVEQQTIQRDVHWNSLSGRESHFTENGHFPHSGNCLAPTSQASLLSTSDIRATFEAVAQQEERCAITGQLIGSQQAMWLGLTITGAIVPLSFEVISNIK